MKRSLSSSSGSGRSTGVPIPISADGSVTESDLNNEMFLRLQNQQLLRNSKRYKSEISDCNKELVVLRQQSKDMESLVSLIQRSWSQLDFDATLLLNEMDSSSSSTTLSGEANPLNNSELLESLLSAGDRFRTADATALERLPTLSVDEWSAIKEIEMERLKTLEVLKSQVDKINSNNNNSNDNNSNSNDDDDKNNDKNNDNITESREEVGEMDEDDVNGDGFGLEECVKDSLRSHSQFTLSLISRIFQSKSSNLSEGSIQAMAKAKELHAQNAYYTDRISKLSSTIISLKAAVWEGKKQVKTVERSLEKLQAEFDVRKSSENSLNSNNNINNNININSRSNSAADTSQASISQSMDISDNSSNSVGASKAPQSQEPPVSTSKNLDELAEIQTRLAVLTQQLTDSEAARTQLEINLTDALAGSCRAVSGTDAETEKNQAKVAENIRGLYENRLSTLSSENISLSEKVSTLESSLYKIDSDSRSKIEKIVTTTSGEIETLKSENESLKRDVSSFKSQLVQLHQLQSLVEDFHFIEKSLKQETSKLQDRIKILNSDIERLNNAVSASRSREAVLENNVVVGATNSVETMVKQNQQRMAEYEAESQALNASLNDMILEIEAVSAGDSKLRQDFARILLQLKDSQREAAESLSQCMGLKDEVVDLKKANVDAETKRTSFETIFKRQDGIINQLRSLEQVCRSELSDTRALYKEAADKLSVSELASAESQQRLIEVEAELRHNKDRCNLLHTRCGEMAKKYEGERKLRMNLQREGNKKKDKDKDKDGAGESTPRDSSNSSSGGGSGSDMEMLDMTLGMLRCSVCRDRFKEVVINRCFHLFCRQCIDNSLKSRQRKCPACGEKFGQDDVKTIYFTN